MPKPNAYLLKMQIKKELEMQKARLFTIQQCKDMLLIAAHDAFGFGPARLKRLSDAYDAAFMDYANLTLTDAETDKELWYMKGKIDEELRRICGEHFVPWEERYGS